MATRGLGAKKIAAALGVREATWRRATSGDRVVRRLVCVSCFSCYLSHIARIVMCASRLLVRGCEKERVRAAALVNAWIPLEPCCTVASVRKRLQASGIERGRSSVQRLMTAEHWPAKQVICG